MFCSTYESFMLEFVSLMANSKLGKQGNLTPSYVIRVHGS